jgi:hypothetical protein
MKTLICLLAAVLYLLCDNSHAAQTSEWQVNLTRGTSNTFVRMYKGSTKELAEAACAAGVPTNTTTSTTYTCNAARRIFVVTPTVVTCPPPPPSRPGTCPAGTSGTWTQTATVGPPPECTVTWSTAPAGACVPIAANSKLLSWTPPTTNTDGSALTDLIGYDIVYGINRLELFNVIRVAVPNATAYRVTNLAPGTWYFAVMSVAADGDRNQSNVISSVVQ